MARVEAWPDICPEWELLRLIPALHSKERKLKSEVIYGFRRNNLFPGLNVSKQASKKARRYLFVFVFFCAFGEWPPMDHRSLHGRKRYLSRVNLPFSHRIRDEAQKRNSLNWLASAHLLARSNPPPTVNEHGPVLGLPGNNAQLYVQYLLLGWRPFPGNTQPSLWRNLWSSPRASFRGAFSGGRTFAIIGCRLKTVASN